MNNIMTSTTRPGELVVLCDTEPDDRLLVEATADGAWITTRTADTAAGDGSYSLQTIYMTNETFAEFVNHLIRIHANYSNKDYDPWGRTGQHPFYDAFPVNR